ncbi:MAG: AbrB/MazE/SpoVT family DNA-binding domain-containing protein [Cyanobacteriota bacterium]
MVIAKRTSKNQLTFPKAVVEQVGNADYYEVICEDGCIVLTPVHPGAAAAVRSRLAELGISEADVADAVRWARQPSCCRVSQWVTPTRSGVDSSSKAAANSAP